RGEMVGIFLQISLIILIVFFISLIVRIFKQPLIIGYIISGIILGPLVLGFLPGVEVISVFSEFGVAFLLFVIGLYLSPKVIKEVGRISLITGLGQILFTAFFAYIISIILGFDKITSLYIAVALTFSSTIIILKLLSDKGDIDNLYGKISIGFLLVQDLVAIMVLIFISSFTSFENFIISMTSTFIKGGILTLLLILISTTLLPKIWVFFAKSQELLFVFSIAWGLGIASAFYYIGLSIEVGALLAGILLSFSPYPLEISSKLKPLRDFFIISFFLLLGSQITVENLRSIIGPSTIFSLLILIGNPLIIMSLMGLEGFTKKTSFLAGLTVAQVGEFSLITIALGVKVGHISHEILSMMTLTSLITIGICTYFVLYSNKLYTKLSKYLTIFEKRGSIYKKIKIENEPEVILFGYNRIGFGILKSLKKMRKNYLVIDFNPDIISDLNKFGIPAIYGDAEDDALIKSLPLEKIKIVISTIPDFETNKFIVENVKSRNKEAIVILRAHTIRDAISLYESKADYVLTPHFLGGEYLAKMLLELKTDQSGYENEKRKHMKILIERLRLGHEHPEI
ncbi:MAG: cation:proton antiporter, partial [Candidatus Pacearchaeota archaeon]